MTEMIKFVPQLKQTLWGGNKIATFKHIDKKALPHTSMENIGESWEISGVEGSVSVVAEGPLKGRNLNELIMMQKGLLVGQANYERFGNEFPLLVKFIDATHDLSIQVHPNDEVARRHGYHHGKTEMWYCIGGGENNQSDNIPTLYCGLKKKITPQQYEQMVATHTITDALARYEVHDGDAFFIPAGRVHSIGAGCFVAEIQQTSNVTYRIYDFNRRDKDGNLRQLHTKEAAESIDYNVLDDYRTYYGKGMNERRQIVACPHFTTAVYDLDRPMLLDYSQLDSFVILMGLEGSATLETDNKKTSLNAGETVLLTAAAREITVRGQVRFLEAYI